MSLSFPNGAVFGFSTLGTAVPVSAISNANPAVATATAEPAAGSIVVVQSGWSAINNRATAMGASGALTGIDTSDTGMFPADDGAGSLLPADTFVDFNQQGAVTSSGGDQQFWTGQLLEDPNGTQIQIPTFKNAKTITIPLYYDPSAAWFAAAKAADQSKDVVALRLKLPNGDAIYYAGYLSFDADPDLTVNQPMQVTATFSRLNVGTLVSAS